MPCQTQQMKMWDTPSLSWQTWGTQLSDVKHFCAFQFLTLTHCNDVCTSSFLLWILKSLSLQPLHVASQPLLFVSNQQCNQTDLCQPCTALKLQKQDHPLFLSCHNFMLVTHHMPISNVNKYFIDGVNLFCRDWSLEWDKLFTYQFYDLGKSLRASKFISFIWKMELEVNRVAVKGKWARILKHCMASVESLCYFRCFHFFILLLPSYLLFVKVNTINYFYRIKRQNFSITKATVLYILKI